MSDNKNYALDGMIDNLCAKVIELTTARLSGISEHQFQLQRERDVIRAAVDEEIAGMIRANEKDVNLLRSYYEELRGARAFHHRAMKLITKRKNFVVVADDEPYYLEVYKTIRACEIAKGRWSDADEDDYRAALAKLHESQ